MSLDDNTTMQELAIDTNRVADLLCSFLRSETEKAGKRRLIVGLSGGLDSAVSAFLAQRALGKDGAAAVIMPYRESSPANLGDARQVVDMLGIESVLVDISPLVDSYFASFPDADRVRRGNAMARARMIVLYDQSVVHDALVLGTGNKTERLLGYTTLWGDMACAVNPLGNLYKTQVRQLARALGVPDSIVDKPPSADLWDGQTDEGELGFAYADVDRLLYYMIDESCEQHRLEELGFSRDFIERVRQRIRATEFKRRMPRIAEIDGPCAPP
jgi:NAD+ synthase